MRSPARAYHCGCAGRQRRGELAFLPDYTREEFGWQAIGSRGRLQHQAHRSIGVGSVRMGTGRSNSCRRHSRRLLRGYACHEHGCNGGREGSLHWLYSCRPEYLFLKIGSVLPLAINLRPLNSTYGILFRFVSFPRVSGSAAGNEAISAARYWRGRGLSMPTRRRPGDFCAQLVFFFEVTPAPRRFANSGHPLRLRASPSSHPIAHAWSRGGARHTRGRRSVRHAAGPCRDRGARFRTPFHAHRPTSRICRRKPIVAREFRPARSRCQPPAHAHSRRESSHHDTTGRSPP